MTTIRRRHRARVAAMLAAATVWSTTAIADESAASAESGIFARPSAPLADDAYAAARHELVETIRRYSAVGPRAISERVMAQMARVPRHEFVPEDACHAAYKDMPLAIGNEQTISQPYIVALMTELASVKAGDVVLEIGTGSGYQAAVLSGLARQVYTIEIVEPLGRQAAATLARLGYRNVEVRIGDGYKGWPEHAPFDAILVTAAPDHVPQPLIDQLRTGGKLVVPVGSAGGNQNLTVLEKKTDGSIAKSEVLPVRFVPLTRSPESDATPEE